MQRTAVFSIKVHSVVKSQEKKHEVWLIFTHEIETEFDYTP